MSNIEWTERTWNPVIGCTPVSPGCLNCYAATMANRMQHMPNAPEYAPRECNYCHGTGAVERDGSDTGCPQCKQSRTIRIAEVRNGRAVFTGDVRCLEDRLTDPLHWKKPRMVFVNSMSDLFHEDVPFEFVDKVMAIAALCPQHTFQILTKRPERMREYFADRSWGDVISNLREDNSELCRKFIGLCDYDAVMSGTRQGIGGYCTPREGRKQLVPNAWPLPNVWLGTSVENQKCADDRIPHLLATPAAVRFLSCEPLLDRVYVGRFMAEWKKGLHGDPRDSGKGLHWVIVGGESGPHSRPCHVEWIRSIVQQCQAASVPVFVKQLGARPCMNYYAWARWCEERAWDSDEARLETPHGAEWDIERDGQPRRDVLAHFPNRNGDRKGSDISEWPEDLRVRQMPGEGRV